MSERPTIPLFRGSSFVDTVIDEGQQQHVLASHDVLYGHNETFTRVRIGIGGTEFDVLATDTSDHYLAHMLAQLLGGAS